MFSIGQRLFAAVLLSYLAIGALGLTLARWHLANGTPVAASQSEANALESLKAELQSLYLSHGNWLFLPSDATQRRDWLRDAFQRLQPGPQGGASGSEALSPTLGDRLGLVDTAGQVLAGRVPSRALIAVASIDTRVRTLEINGRAIGQLVESRSDNPKDALAVAFLLDQQRNLAIVAGLGLVVGALVAACLAVCFRRPIRKLVAGAHALESGLYAARLAVDRSDELGQLAVAFNQLAARLDAAEQARAQWVADTSHELRTPLTVVRAQIEALQDGIRHATPEHLSVMLCQIMALTRLVDDLGALAQPQVGDLGYSMQRIDVWPLVADVASSFRNRAQGAGLHVELAPAPARSAVRGDAARLRQVLSNVIENSVRYTAAGGRIEISAQNDAQALHVRVADSSPGVPRALLGHLGERLFRAEPSRSRASGGAGLGLAICTRIVEGHGGRIAFASSALGGLQVSIELPFGDVT